jgi:hypothetical protein
VRLDRQIDLGQGMDAHVAGPGQLGLGLQDRNLRLRRGAAADAGDRGAVGRQEGREIVGPGDGRRQADAPCAWRELREPRQAQRQQIAALGPGQRMQLVDHDGLEAREDGPRLGI